MLYYPNYPGPRHTPPIGETSIAIGVMINIYGREPVPLIDHIGCILIKTPIATADSCQFIAILMIVPASTADIKATPEFVP